MYFQYIFMLMLLYLEMLLVAAFLHCGISTFTGTKDLYISANVYICIVYTSFYQNTFCETDYLPQKVV